MKLVVAIVSADDANRIQKILIEEKLFSTKLQTTGSFLRSKNQTFLIGINDEMVPKVLDIIETHSKKRTKMVPNTIINEFGSFSTIPVEVEVGGATVFVLDVDQFIKI